MQQRCHKVPDDQDRQIGRAVIGARMTQILAADRACVAQLEIALEDRTAAAIGAFARKPFAQGGPKLAVGLVGGGIAHGGGLSKRLRKHGETVCRMKGDSLSLRRDVANLLQGDAKKSNNGDGSAGRPRITVQKRPGWRRVSRDRSKYTRQEISR